jgi:hypothetical protein
MVSLGGTLAVDIFILPPLLIAFRLFAFVMGIVLFAASIAGLTAALYRRSGDADIAPIDDADIFIAGSGDVRLHTHPKHLNSKAAGSGQIIELSGEQQT